MLFAPRRTRTPRRRPCRRHPRQRRRRRAHRHRRRRRQGGRHRRRGRRIGCRHRRQEALDRSGRARARRRGCLVGGQDRACAHRQRRERAASKRLRPSRAWPSRRRASASRVAHYNGATLWFPNAAGAKPETLEWKGSHLGVAFSPDGKFLVTTMQEPTLHGWRLADAKHMRMSGYSARVRSLRGPRTANSSPPPAPSSSSSGRSTARTGRWASSRSCWRVARRASPSSPAIRASRWRRSGYADGAVMLVRIDDGALIQAKAARARPGQRARLGRERADARLRHRGGRSRRATFIIAAALRPTIRLPFSFARYDSRKSYPRCCVYSGDCAHLQTGMTDRSFIPPPAARRC